MEPERFDLLVLDVMIPGIDGLSLCRAVRNGRANRDVPILSASGSRPTPGLRDLSETDRNECGRRFPGGRWFLRDVLRCYSDESGPSPSETEASDSGGADGTGGTIVMSTSSSFLRETTIVEPGSRLRPRT